jgi:hypothetical protein
VTGASIEVRERTDDRSYTVDGTKARAFLGFLPAFTVKDAAVDIKARFDSGYWKETSEPHFKNVAHGLV